MIKLQNLGKSNCNCTIFRTILMVMVAMMIFFLSSCVTPRTIKNTSKNQKLASNTEENENLDPKEYIKMMDELQNKNLKSEPQEENIKPLLEPLEKQIANLQTKQIKTDNKISKIDDDIKSLTKKYEDLKKAIEILQNGSTALAGPAEESNDEPVIATIKAPKENFIMKSDEEEDYEEPAVKPAPKKKENKKENNFAKALITPKKPIYEAKKETETPITQEKKSEKEELNQISFDLAKAYLDKKDYSNAISKLKDISDRIEQPKDKSNCNLMLGDAHFGLKQYAEAIKYFMKVLELPEIQNYDKARIMLAESNLAVGEVENAKKSYKELISTNPKSKYVAKARMMLQQL